jgi:hypothetical protein
MHPQKVAFGVNGHTAHRMPLSGLVGEIGGTPQLYGPGSPNVGPDVIRGIVEKDIG